MGNRWLDQYEDDYKREIAEYTLQMSGAPVRKVDESVHEAILHYIDRAYQYDVNNKVQYVYEEVSERIEQTEDGTLFAPEWLEDCDAKL